MDFSTVIKTRRTVRKFTSDPVPDDVLQRCIDAGRLAASSSNLQPWEYVIIRSPEMRQRFDAICMNQSPVRSAPLLLAIVAHWDTWNKHRRYIHDEFVHRGNSHRNTLLYYSKLLPLVYRQGPFGLAGKGKKLIRTVRQWFGPQVALPMSREDLRVIANRSTALGAAQLMLALVNEGYDSCPMEGFDKEAAARLLQLGRNSEVAMILAAGKRAVGGVWWERILVPRTWTVRDI